MGIRLLQNLSICFNVTELSAKRPTVKRARLRHISLAAARILTQRCQELHHHKTITSDPSLTLALSFLKTATPCLETIISSSKTVPRLTPHACLRIGWQLTLPILSEKMSGLQTLQILILWIIVFRGAVSRLSKA